MRIACLAVEGVLAAGDDLKRAQPTKWGRSLYEALATEFRMILFTQADPEIAQWWLKQEMLKGWAGVMTQEPYLEYPDWKVRQIEDFLAEGWEVGLVLDVDPNVLERVTELGVLTLLLSYPTTKVGWKSRESSPRPWADVSGTL
jgi:hypothetical protein